MNVFFVYQGKTFKEEVDGGYIWAPKETKKGSKHKGFTNVSEIRKGDYIFHCDNAKIKAISIAEDNCESSIMPENLRRANSADAWNDDGYRVKCHYIILEKPLGLTPHRQWLRDNHEYDSAFTKSGGGRQQYMCHLPDKHVEYLLTEIRDLQPSIVREVILQPLFSKFG